MISRIKPWKEEIKPIGRHSIKYYFDAKGCLGPCNLRNPILEISLNMHNRNFICKCAYNKKMSLYFFYYLLTNDNFFTGEEIYEKFITTRGPCPLLALLVNPRWQGLRPLQPILAKPHLFLANIEQILIGFVNMRDQEKK